MTPVLDLIAAARAAGIEFRVVAGQVQFRPTPAPPEAAPIIEQLRQHRPELPAAVAATAPDWRPGTVCPGCLALRWLDPAGARRCDCGGQPAPPAPVADPAPTDHPIACNCSWCWAWRRRQDFHAAILRAPAGQRFEPATFPRDYSPCPCGGDHRPCGLTGRCGLECSCGLCEGWRKARVQ